MGENALVESQVSDAMALIKELDSRGLAPSLAAWYFYDDAQEWRLLLAGPAFDELLPKQEPVAYRKLVDAMTKLSPASLTLSDVKLLSSKSPLAQALRVLIGTAPNAIARAHFTNTTLNGIFIKEMVVLRSSLGRAA
jgi:hypothetical protein